MQSCTAHDNHAFVINYIHHPCQTQLDASKHSASQGHGIQKLNHQIIKEAFVHSLVVVTCNLLSLLISLHQLARFVLVSYSAKPVLINQSKPVLYDSMVLVPDVVI